jgi:membrane-bound lytic murein transglycosylase B
MAPFFCLNRCAALAAIAGFSLSLSGTTLVLAQTPLSGRPDVEAFLDDISSRYQIDRRVLAVQFAGLSTDPKVLRLIQPIPPGEKSWRDWRSSHLDPIRIKEGRRFYTMHSASLMAAQRTTGVPAEIITAILGIETNYGRDKGSFQVLRTLSTLAFNDPERADEFRPQLVDFVLLAREQHQSPLSYLGSYAGAMGYPQFMPSSWRKFGVDGDGDGKIDLINSVDDAIFSVATFLRHHGWVPGKVVAIPVTLPLHQARLIRSALDADRLNLSLQQLLKAQVKPVHGELVNEPAILVDLPTPGQPTEYWIGYPNFYALMEYNRLFFYAMAVYQLSLEIATN